VFVPLAERLGLAPLLTDTVLESAAGELARWSALLGHHDLRVSVNVSPQEFADHELVTRVHALLSRHDIHPDQLILEVTESAVTNDLRIDAAVLAELRRLGVHLALDDFGVGLSSLGRLQRLPFDYLKIDRSMVIGIDTDPTRAQVLTAVTQLGDTLGMRVIAEGVETAGQLAALERGGRPPLIQGYLFGRPGPPASLDAALHHAPAARA
jgi:EAL domain-containing protein (putative c-di-GMP-specific phosphodiesterase class I)